MTDGTLSLFEVPRDVPAEPYEFGADIERDQQRLVSIAGELALRAGRHGITASDIRIAAVNAGVFTEHETEARMRALNLGVICKRAGLFPTGQYRRSDVPRAHKNLNLVWVVREFAEGAA